MKKSFSWGCQRCWERCKQKILLVTNTKEYDVGSALNLPALERERGVKRNRKPIGTFVAVDSEKVFAKLPTSKFQIRVLDLLIASWIGFNEGKDIIRLGGT